MPLPHDSVAMTNVKLDPMTSEEYSEYSIDNIRRYAAAGVKAGRWEERESLRESEKSIKESLPKGMHTKNNFFFNLRDRSSGKKLGVLWLSVLEGTMTKSVFVYDIIIHAKYRNKGFGTDAMTEIEEWATAAGARTIWLHVFWHNQGALALYKKLGYSESGVTMRKSIPLRHHSRHRRQRKR